MSEDNKSWTWEENVGACAARFSKKIEEAFVFEMKKGEAFLPHKHLAPDVKETQDEVNRQRIVQMEIFIDYFIGTTIALLSNYGSLESDFEDHILQIVKDKFDRLRSIRKMREEPRGLN